MKTILKNTITIKALFTFLLSVTIFLGQAQVRINEVMNTNVQTAFDPDFGAYSDWIELKNVSDSTVDISGWYLGDLNTKYSWQFPDNTVIQPDSFLFVWADGKDLFIDDKAIRIFTKEEEITIAEFHSNFGLNNENEAVYLSNANRSVIDSVVLPIVPLPNISVGAVDGRYVFYDSPSPRRENGAFVESAIQTSSPFCSRTGGKINSGETIILSTTNENASIYYTTDGSVPDTTSFLYTEPISIHTSQVIKAIAYEPSKLSSEVITNTYFTKVHDISVVSVSADPADIWGFDFGIHQNAYKDREVPVTIELYETSGDLAFNENAGMQLFGTQIFNLDQKPMGFYFRGKYGESTLNYKLFDDKKVSEFKHFVLRNGGNDNGMTMFRDGLVQTLGAEQLDYEYQSYRPAAVYLNGEYWGLYNIRDKLNAQWLEHAKGVNSNRVDLIEDSLIVKDGDSNHYTQFLEYLETTDMTSETTYQQLHAYMDVDQFIDYTILKIYAGYYIWDWNNKYWREKSAEGRWRWFIFDMEHSFLGPSGDQYTDNTLAKLLDEDNSELPEWSLFLLQKLFQNESFRNTFAQRMIVHLHITFTSERISGVIDEMQATIASEMQNHINKWKQPQSISVWFAHVLQLYDYANNRPNYTERHLQELFQIDSVYNASVHFDELMGNVSVHGVQLDSSYNGKLYSDINTEFKAIPKPGYRFVGWEHGVSSLTLNGLINSDTLFTALFELDDSNVLPDTVRNTLVLKANGKPYVGKSDVVIQDGAKLLIEKGVEIQMAPSANIWVYGTLQVQGTIDNQVLITSFYEDEKWGAICAQDADSTVYLKYTVVENATWGDDKDFFKAAISTRSSDVVLDNVTVPLADNPVYCFEGRAQISNCTLRSNAVCDLINLEQCFNSLIENCQLKGNYAEDADALDIDNVDSVVIRGNTVSGFWGSNSDGIDLGGGTRRAYVQSNFIQNCNDKGISIGSQAHVFVSNNIIVGCGQGVGMKDSSTYAYLDRNTFYQNDIAFACFEKALDRGTGSADLVNCLFAESGKHVWIQNPYSVSISYSLSTGNYLPGDSNIIGDPLFKNVSVNDFMLQPNSPCIDAGDPKSEYDLDGTRADIGAYVYKQSGVKDSILISEIHYKSAEAFECPDWVELYNYSSKTIDVSSWVLRDSNDDNQFYLPFGTTIPVGEFLVIASDKRQLKDQMGVTAIGNITYGFGRNGDEVRLFNADGELVSSVRYQNAFPWAKEADGMGVSIEVIDYTADIQNPNNWQASVQLGGTPGTKPVVRSLVDDIVLNEIASVSNVGHDWFELYNANPELQSIGGLYVSDRKDNPAKYYIPLYDTTETSVRAENYKIMYASAQPDSGVLHTNFKLSSQGEYLGLYQIVNQDTILLDEVDFPALTSEFTYGRSPNDNSMWGEMYPSKGEQNTAILLGISSKENELIKVFPNPCNDFLKVSSSSDGEIQLFSIQGQLLESETLIEGDNLLDLSMYSAGTYQIVIIANTLSESFLFVKQ